MSSAAANRETVRDALASLLETALVGVGLPCSEVLNYDSPDIRATSLRVLSGGSSRKQFGMGSTKYHNRFKFILRWFVKAASAADGWTELHVEDTLDLVDKLVADVVMDNQQTANWKKLMYDADQMSMIAPAVPVTDTSGKPYMMEETVLIAEVYDGS